MRAGRRADTLTAMPPSFVILGAGFTGARVAARLAAEGAEVLTVARSARPAMLPATVHWLQADLATLDGRAAVRAALPAGALALLSVPTLEGADGPFDPGAAILEALAPVVARWLYLSTTGVYGAAREVDESTAVAAATERTRGRLQTEAAVLSRGGLVLRPAAIYGPGRGLHVALREGRHRLVEGGHGFVSRIHVEDLAAHCVAGLRSTLAGAFPVADEAPSPSRETAAWVCERLSLPLPGTIPRAAAPETLRGDRRVDGRAIRTLLGLTLRYPSYREGLPACWLEESNPPSAARA